MSFKEISEEITKEFLQTVVVVDDKAEFIDKDDNAEVISGVPKEGDALKKSEPKEETNLKTFVDTENLNAKKIIDSFAQYGMVCSVLKPYQGELDLVDKVIQVAKRVDVVVLDWNLNGDNGSSTIEIIKSLLNTDTPPRLRLIVIYTGENKTSIVDDVLIELRDKTEVSFENWEHTNGLKIGHTLISVFVKKGVSTKFSIEPEELPQKIIEEFTKIYSGLIPSTALKSIGILRDNTHNLLGTLKSELDPPYLSHRALLPQPEDAEEHILDLSRF
ncbi:MAG: hypothetical protein IH950_01735 [Bacteroidetes bacterium]|nr:hypothetical protein [Bacteroidota bacterium]